MTRDGTSNQSNARIWCHHQKWLLYEGHVYIGSLLESPGENVNKLLVSNEWKEIRMFMGDLIVYSGPEVIKLFHAQLN